LYKTRFHKDGNLWRTLDYKPIEEYSKIQEHLRYDWVLANCITCLVEARGKGFCLKDLHGKPYLATWHDKITGLCVRCGEIERKEDVNGRTRVFK